jgi:hypothetical protein
LQTLFPSAVIYSSCACIYAQLRFDRISAAALAGQIALSVDMSILAITVLVYFTRCLSGEPSQLEI